MSTRRAVTDEMSEANYLVGHPDGRYYRLLMRCFYERHRSHANYVRSDELVAYVRQFEPYDENNCRRHLDMLEQWGLITLLPEQSKPANLLDLRLKPRVYRAERLALRLEELRVDEEEGETAVSLDPAALPLLVQRVADLHQWIEQGGLSETDNQQETYNRWSGAYETFLAFSRRVEDYLTDLPRHRPRELLDYRAFIEYRDLVARYLADFARRLFDHRDQLRDLLSPVHLRAEFLAMRLASIEVEQVRSDGSRPDFERQRQRFLRDIRGLVSYFADKGDVDILLERAQGWVQEVARHARRLSEQHTGGSVRQQTLLDLAQRFADAPRLAHAEALAQVVFAMNLPLHWRGQAPPGADEPAWSTEATTVPLYAVRRGPPVRVKPQATVDRSDQALQHMLEKAAERERAAQELADLFGPEGEIDLGRIVVTEGRHRQLLLRLLYKALSNQGVTGVGFGNWTVSAHLPAEAPLGALEGPDGRALLPGAVLRLHRGGRV